MIISHKTTIAKETKMTTEIPTFKTLSKTIESMLLIFGCDDFSSKQVQILEKSKSLRENTELSKAFDAVCSELEKMLFVMKNADKDITLIGFFDNNK